MLVSNISKNNNYGYVENQMRSTMPEGEGFSVFQKGREDIVKNICDKSFRNEFLSEFCESLLNSCGVCKSDVFSNTPSEKSILKNYQGGSKSEEVKQLVRKVDLEWNSDEENYFSEMSNNKENGCEKVSGPSRIGPQTSRMVMSHLNEHFNPDRSVINYVHDDKFNNDNPRKTNNSTQLNFSSSAASRHRSRTSFSMDEETNFSDIFDLMYADEGATSCNKLYDEKDELVATNDVLTKYERNLELDFIKDENVCWSAGNMDNEVCPLSSYDASNENTLWNFSKENLDSESQGSFPCEWAFNECIDSDAQEQMLDPQLVLPKKTVDITKIKGWKKKIFSIEKCLANNNSVLKSVRLKSEPPDLPVQKNFHEKCEEKPKTGNDGSKNCAFVCDELDDFLDQEAELKINYEIPHLYAEYGIKLTSEEIVSRPKFDSNESKSFHADEMKKQTTSPDVSCPSTFIANGEEKNKKPVNYSFSKDNQKSKSALLDKLGKSYVIVKQSHTAKGKPMAIMKREFSIKKEKASKAVALPSRRSTRVMQNNVLNKVKLKINNNKRYNYDSEQLESKRRTPESLSKSPNLNFPGYTLVVRKFGLVLYPGPFAPLNPFIRYHLQKIRSHETFVDSKWANFAVSAVLDKTKPEKRKRMVLPLMCCFKYKNSESVEAVANSNENVNNCHPNVHVDKNIENEVYDTVEFLLNHVCENIERESLGSKLCHKLDPDDLEKAIQHKNLEDKNIEKVAATGDNIIDGNKIFNPVDMDLESSKKEESHELSECNNKASEEECSYISTVSNSRKLPEKIDLEEKKIESKKIVKLPSYLILSGDINEPSFNTFITEKLVKKLNELKLTHNITNSIDNLKVCKTNALELIKLNFVKENFLSGYINLWYLKSKNTTKRRVFLTFSMHPPAKGAINLKKSQLAESDLPNIIKEIISEDNLFNANDFAILYSDGKKWEIHGSVNFRMDKNHSDVLEGEKIQIFHLVDSVLRELILLNCIRPWPTNEATQTRKWWVTHIMQNFSELSIQLGNKIGWISQSLIMRRFKAVRPSFISFNGLKLFRAIGVVVSRIFWPYIFIGPYNVGDNHDLTLELHSKVVPFQYYPHWDVINPKFQLMQFISSVIMQSWKNGRQVLGIWLYENVFVDQGSFLEVKTRTRKTGIYEPGMDHDYSMSQTGDGNPEVKMNLNRDIERDRDKEIKNKIMENPNIKNENLGINVFLVSNIRNLGHIPGHLHPDKSITIEHPLKPGRWIKSRLIGDWINKLLKRRIVFIPNDLKIKWSIVRSSALLGKRKSLNKMALGGTHILCKKGLFYLLSLNKEKIKKLGLNESVVMETIKNNSVIQEVLELKELGKILMNKDKCNMKIADVLQLALSEIEKLEKEGCDLEKTKDLAEKERDFLCQKYEKALENSVLDDNAKKKIHFYMQRVLKGRNSETNVPSLKKVCKSESLLCLEAIDEFLTNSLVESANHHETKNKDTVVEKPVELIEVPETPEKQSSGKENDNYDKLDENNLSTKTLQTLESKIKNLHYILKKNNTNNSSVCKKLQERLDTMSEYLSILKGTQEGANKDSNVILKEGSLPSDCETVSQRNLEASRESDNDVFVIEDETLCNTQKPNCIKTVCPESETSANNFSNEVVILDEEEKDKPPVIVLSDDEVDNKTSKCNKRKIGEMSVKEKCFGSAESDLGDCEKNSSGIMNKPVLSRDCGKNTDNKISPEDTNFNNQVRETNNSLCQERNKNRAIFRMKRTLDGKTLIIPQSSIDLMKVRKHLASNLKKINDGRLVKSHNFIDLI